MDDLELYDGDTTIDLNDGSSYRLIDWRPSFDGVERILFEVLGTTTQMATRVRAVELMLEQVERWKLLRLGPQWRLRWTPNGLSDQVSSYFLHDEKNEMRARDRQSRRWELRVRRETFWRGAEIDVPLSNRHATDNTAGIDVDNTDDSSRDNWVEIDGDDIDGDMPALAQIYAQNSDADELDELHFGNRMMYEAGESFPKLTLENDEADYIAGSQTSNAAYSGGNYHSGSIGSETDIAYWALSDGFLGEWDGFWRVLVRGDFPDEVWGEVRYVSHAPVQTLLTMEGVDGTGPFVDLGVLRLPPWQTSRVRRSEGFRFYIVANGSGTWWLDCVWLLPATEGYRKFWFDAAHVGQGYGIWDDGVNGDYGFVTGNQVAQVGNVVGRRVQLVPGYDQRIYFTQVGIDGGEDCDISRQVLVTIDAVPRYRFFED